MQKYVIGIKIASAMIVAAFLVGAPTLANSINAPYSEQFRMDKGEAYGTIASIQSKQGDSPAWLLSGHWKTNIINKTIDDFNQSNPASFDAMFSMVMLNGSAKHKHQVSNFSLTDVKDENDTVVYKGQATVTMKDGPVTEIPTEIKIHNNNVISIWFDPTKVKTHFGVSPIYGAVITEKEMESKGTVDHKNNT
ncbi:MAG: hypothetical protein QN424_08715 [Nitrososphaeraceae archaeon]|nr:hypothetical protein [Nitrososphaeraceae archaeon]MDW0342408.1 hypothetical protein [Nitrososphaeraceae archaeon]